MERRQVVAREFLPPIVTRATMGFRVDHLRHVLDFVGALHLGVRCQDLLHEGRTGTRDADDQDCFTAEFLPR